MPINKLALVALVALVPQKNVELIKPDALKELDAPDAQLCVDCGASFTCGSLAGWSRCWCEDLPALTEKLDVAKSCYCPQCLEKRIKTGTKKIN